MSVSDNVQIVTPELGKKKRNRTTAQKTKPIPVDSTDEKPNVLGNENTKMDTEISVTKCNTFVTDNKKRGRPTTPLSTERNMVENSSNDKGLYYIAN